MKITTTTRNIKSNFTREMINDLNKMHGIDTVQKMESELIKSFKINNRIINRMKSINKILNY